MTKKIRNKYTIQYCRHNNIFNELDPNRAFENLTTTVQQTIDLVAPGQHVVTISEKIDSLNHGCQMA